MKSRMFAVAFTLLAACEPPAVVDPCADGYQKLQGGDLDGAIAGLAKALPSDGAHRTAIELSLGNAIAKKAAGLAAKGQTQDALNALREAQSSGAETLKNARAQLVPMVMPSIHAAAAKEPAKAVDLLKWLLSVAKDEAAPHAGAVAARIAVHGWESMTAGQHETAAGSFASAAALLDENTLERDDLLVLADLARARVVLARNPRDGRDAVARTMARRKTESTAALARAWLKEAIDAGVEEHLKKEEHDAAIAAINEAIQLIPDQTAWWYTQKLRALVAKSDAAFQQNRLPAALPPLQEAMNLPIDVKPMVNAKIRGIAMRLGTAAMRAGDWTDAIGHFEMAAGADDRDPLVFELRVQCYEQKQLWRQAAGDYEVLATLIPERKAELLEKAKVTRAKFKPADANGPRD